MADKFEDLLTYVTVVSSGGINAAAAELGIAKSAVSRRISDLETRLGAKLIERSTRRFEVTAVGQAYFEGATDLLARLQSLDGSATESTSTETVSISAASIVLRHLLARPLASFVSEHPHLALQLLDANAQADIIIDEDGRASFDRNLIQVRSGLYAARAYLDAHGVPQTASDLATHTGVLTTRQGKRWNFAGGGSRSPKAIVVAPDTDVAASLALEGAGIVQLPDYVARSAAYEGRLVELLTECAPAAGQLTATLSDGASAMARALVDHITASLAGKD